MKHKVYVSLQSLWGLHGFLDLNQNSNSSPQVLTMKAYPSQDEPSHLYIVYQQGMLLPQQVQLRQWLRNPLQQMFFEDHESFALL